MGRLIDKDKLIAEYDRVHQGPPGGARKLMAEAEDVPAIPLDWIRGYIDRLKDMGVVISIRDAQAVSVMVDKWAMEQNGNATCGPDYCEIGGTHND
jgi:hypothetical protein